MIFATSDLHGYSLIRLIDLLHKAGFTRNDFLFVLGDVIDRNGDGGIDLLRWMMLQPNVELILGNHEAMLLECMFLFEEITDSTIERLNADKIEKYNRWFFNGAEPTLRSLKKLKRQEPEEFEALMEYLQDAPLYEKLSLSNGDFLLVHSGLGNFDSTRPIEAYRLQELLWHRPAADERYFEDMMTIFGHTPTAYYGTDRRMHCTDTWIDIDTGAAGGDSPMLLRLDDMRPYYA